MQGPFTDAPSLSTLASVPFMERPGVLTFLFDAVGLFFVLAFGACLGSLMNVLVYRIPRGLPYGTPTSRCPSCDTKLTWRENIPVLGWLGLGGKCRFCRTPISGEYPIVEAVTAVLWALTYFTLYAGWGSAFGFLRPMQPEWALSSFVQTWPIFIVLVVLWSFLVGMTAVDLKTHTIPWQFTTFPLVVGFVGHVGLALWVQVQGGDSLRFHAPDTPWSIPTPGAYGWPWVGAALGGTLGVLVAWGLLLKGVLTPSFGDYEHWMDEAEAKQRAESGDQASDDERREPGLTTEELELWQQYPHTRRETLRELVFLAPALGLASVGAWVAVKASGPWVYNPATLMNESTALVPLWLSVLSGCLLGYLIGAGAVWLFRILGGLAFGKEALGMGDVHMMGAVGVCLGWIDPVLAFFGAAFLGMFGYGLSLLAKGKAKKVLPYGPYLAMATVLVFFGKPLVERGMTALMGADPPLNLP